MFPTHLNPNNFLFYITSNFTPIHVYPRLKDVFLYNHLNAMVTLHISTVWPNLHACAQHGTRRVAAMKITRGVRWDFRFCGFGQFWFGLSVFLRVFSNLVFGFRCLSTIIAVFRISLSNAFDGFSGFGKEGTPCSRAKTLNRRDLLYSLRLLPRLSFRK